MITSPIAFFFELAALAFGMVLAWRFPWAGQSLGRNAGLWATRWVRPWMAPFLCGAVALTGAAAYSLLVQFPAPEVHDEFSYLLAGNTFASGRLTNPTPPFWEHFETFHVLQVPSYASKYPPGQGLLLALGEVLGHPVLGVWIGAGLASALICWMLQGWLPLRWALAGGLLASLSVGFASPWSQTFWGGSLAAAGGALLLGGIGRLCRDSWPGHGVAIALGLTLLAITRPFEGLLFSLPSAFLLAAWTLRATSRGPPPKMVAATGFVILCVMLPPALGLASLNKETTGSATLLPYVEYERQYGAVPVVLWRADRVQPEARNDVFRQLQDDALETEYLPKRTLAGFLAQKPGEVFLSVLEFFHLALIIPLSAMVVSLARRRGPWDWLVLSSTGLVVAATFGNTYTGSRMLAPMAGPLFILATGGLRRIRLWRLGGKPTGRAVARVIVVVMIASTVAGMSPYERISMPRERADLLQELESTRKRHLLFVRYAPDHNPHQEWVYNPADLETAQVIWARDRGPEENRRVIRHFTGREVWILKPDEFPMSLQRYQPEE